MSIVLRFTHPCVPVIQNKACYVVGMQLSVDYVNKLLDTIAPGRLLSQASNLEVTSYLYPVIGIQLII